MVEPATNTDTRMRQGSLPLERKLPLLVLGLFGLVLGISLLVAYVEERQAAIETAAERIAGLGQSLGALVEQQTTTRLNLLRRVSHDTAVVAAFQAPGRPLSPGARRALSALVATPADTGTPPLLWDARGQPLGAPELETPGDRQRFRDELVQPGAAGDSGRVTRLRVSGGRASYFDAVPVHAGDGTLLGFLGQERRFNANPRTFPLLRDLIGSDLEFFVRNAGDNTWVQLTGKSVAPPSGKKATLDSLEIYDHGASGKVLAATAPIRGTPLLITVERPMEAILARPLATIRVLIAISVVLAILGALAVWVLSRRLVRPLGDLTRAAEAIAHGQYSQRVAISRGDEIGRLGSAFNRMASEVQSSAETSTEALDRLTRSIDTQEFLAEASRILSGTVSDDTLLARLANYCVPRLADYCSIHVVDDDGTIRRIETAHRDPARVAVLRSLLAPFQYHIDGPGDVPTVIRTQEPLLVEEVDIAAAVRKAPDAAAARSIEQIAPTSYMCVPLVARGRGFGAITFAMAESKRRLTRDDLEIAMELARRTAGAIDNAVIYHRSLQLRLEAEAASNAKSEFLAKMSHEIRTPINAMVGYAELLQMGISGAVNEAQFQQLARIRSSGDHLTALISEILDLAKIEAGRMAVQSSRAPIGEAIEAAGAVVRPLATTKGVELSSSIDGDPEAEYHGDPQRVQQILTNLLSNAVKFTPPGGRVMIRAEVSARPDFRSSNADWICVSISDTGVGIDAADLDRIFQPFVQVDSGYTRSQGGTGLGLTISRNLAQLMGGDITVESTPGVGSNFTLWLPCAIRALARG